MRGLVYYFQKMIIKLYSRNIAILVKLLYNNVIHSFSSYRNSVSPLKLNILEAYAFVHSNIYFIYL